MPAPRRVASRCAHRFATGPGAGTHACSHQLRAPLSLQARGPAPMSVAISCVHRFRYRTGSRHSGPVAISCVHRFRYRPGCRHPCLCSHQLHAPLSLQAREPAPMPAAITVCTAFATGPGAGTHACSHQLREPAPRPVAISCVHRFRYRPGAVCIRFRYG